MKRLLIIIFLFYFSIVQVYTQENNISTLNNNSINEYNVSYFNQFGIRKLFDVSLSFFFPIERDNYPIALSFVDFGFGFGIDIVNHLLSPGIYFDVGIGSDWFALFGLFASDSNSNSSNDDDDREYNQFAFRSGIRLYNIIRFYDFKLIPFAGYNFLFFYLPSPNAGVSLSLKNIGLEYAYYFSTNSYAKSYHHISIKITIYDEYFVEE